MPAHHRQRLAGGPRATLPSGTGQGAAPPGHALPPAKLPLAVGSLSLGKLHKPKPREKSPSHIKPFNTSLSASEGHKPSSNVIYLRFKAPLQSRDDLWGPGAHDQ